MPRRSLSILILLVLMPSVHGQVKGVLGFPDRVMSSSRIGRVSAIQAPSRPSPDFGRVSFPASGTRPVSKDYDFFNYLIDNDLKQDAITLASERFAESDTLDFLRAKILFSRLKLAQASELFANVPSSSAFGPESFFYRVVALSTLGEYDEASSLLSSPSLPQGLSEGGPYAELAALQAAGLALLRGDEEQWKRNSSLFSYDDYALSEGESVLSEIGASRFSSKGKHAGIAAIASALVPGAGKIYAGRTGEGVAAFLTVGSFGAITAENWVKHGRSDWRTILAGTLCATFYLGNIYGSYMSVSIEKNERTNAENTLILYHLHLPLRSIFR